MFSVSCAGSAGRGETPMQVEVRFTDEERKTLLTMALHTIAHTRDPELRDDLLTLTRKLEGTDTVLVAKRRGYWHMGDSV